MFVAKVTEALVCSSSFYSAGGGSAGHILDWINSHMLLLIQGIAGKTGY